MNLRANFWGGGFIPKSHALDSQHPLHHPIAIRSSNFSTSSTLVAITSGLFMFLSVLMLRKNFLNFWIVLKCLNFYLNSHRILYNSKSCLYKLKFLFSFQIKNYSFCCILRRTNKEKKYSENHLIFGICRIIFCTVC